MSTMQRSETKWMLLLLVIVGCLSGCRQQRSTLATYEPMDNQAALRTLAERAERVKTVQGEGFVTLEREGGDGVRLDSAIAIEFPDHARLRAWKLGQAVFDLTLTPEAVWVFTRGDSDDEEAPPATESAGRFIRRALSYMGGFFTDPDLEVRSQGRDLLLVRKKMEEGQVLTCEIDRATLTPRKYTLTDDAEKVRFTLHLSDYQDYGDGIVWPKRLDAVGENGTIRITMGNVEFNSRIAPRAFTPPRRAEKLP